MVANQPLTVTRKNVLFPGIKSCARDFGVNRITLYRVLKKQLPDRQDLRRRYAQWRREHAL